MKRTIVPLVISLFVLLINGAFAQVGELQIIDDAFESAGVSMFATADLDGDGDNELITSYTGTNGCLAYYNNLGGGQFSERIVLGEPSLARAVGVGFFNDDNLPDIIVGGGISPLIRLYINGDEWDEGETIDNTFLTQINDIVVADFDNNGSDDIVVIGLHSIDFFRNDGNASFTKEAIFTTQSSPNVLECLSIEMADVDNDGDMDLIGAETAGMVIYINDGNGVFTAHYYSPAPEIGMVAVPIDVDNDGHVDVFMKNSLSQLRWYRNNGDGTFELELTYSDTHSLRDMKAVDYNHDGFMDLFFSYANHIAVWLNNNGEGFDEEIILHQNNGLIMGVLFTAELDGINGDDLIWTGGNNTVAYFPCAAEIISSVQTGEWKQALHIFPNPAKDILTIQLPESLLGQKIQIADLTGKIILSVNNNLLVTQINTSSLAAGVYTVCITDGMFQRASIPFIKE